MHNIRPPISEKKFVDSDLDQTSGFRPTFADWFSLTADPLTASVALAVLTGLAKFSLKKRIPNPFFPHLDWIPQPGFPSLDCHTTKVPPGVQHT